MAKDPKTPAKGSAKAAGKAKRPKKPPRVKGARRERLKQVKQAFTVTRQADPRLVWLMLAGFLVPVVLFVCIGLVFDAPVALGVLGVLFGVLGAMLVFGRRVQRTMYAQADGQLGAGAFVLQRMRGDWRVTPAVGFTREQDLVHRVVGRPGVVLVAEGSPARTRGLVANEKKRLARVIGETPLYDVTIGNGDGQVALKDLERHFLKLPRNIKPRTVNELDRRLKALANQQGQLPIPKGPVPMQGRVPRGKMR
jgi:hypothetical protein